MKEQFKKFLNEEQDPKAVEKIALKMSDLLMKNEEIAYIGVQKKPALNVFPDSIVLTNKRILICKPKNFGLSMNFTDYSWKDIAATLVKENLLGSKFSFSTNTDLSVSMNYLPKTQARKIYTYAKEQLEMIRENLAPEIAKKEETDKETLNEETEIIVSENTFAEDFLIEESSFVEEVEIEEIHDFTEISNIEKYNKIEVVQKTENREKTLAEMSQDELIERLKNFKKLLDNGLILQAEYDAKKNEIMPYM